MDISSLTPRTHSRALGGAERVYIVGASGSGKTVLLTQMVEEHLIAGGRAVTLDATGMLDVPGHRTGSVEMPTKRRRSIVYSPEPGAESWWSLLESCYAYDGPLLVAVDELYSLQRIYNRPENPLMALLTRGRSRRKAMICVSQRPYRVPLDVLEQASAYAVFDLAMEESRKRMRLVTGEREMEDRKALGRHDFWWWKPQRQLRKFRLEMDRPWDAISPSG